MQKIVIAAIVVLTGIHLFPQSFNSVHFSIEKLAKGVYAALHKTGGYAICNAGIIDLGDETLVFDCFISPTAANDLKTAAEKLTRNKIKYVINSHFHNDHIRGNDVFDDAEIVSTKRIMELINENEPEELIWEAEVIDQRIETAIAAIANEKNADKLEEHQMWLGYYKAIKESLNDYKITPPNKLFEDSLVINGINRTAVLYELEKGHTESDVVLWLPEEKILFTGDLLFVHRHPWIGDGFIIEWQEHLKDLKKLKPNIIVPGHGSIADESHINELINYLDKLDHIISKAVDEKLTVEDVKLIEIPTDYSSWWFGRFFSPNLTIEFNKRSGFTEQ